MPTKVANKIIYGGQTLIDLTSDTVLAQYALESTSQPIGISEYELSKLFPENFKGTLPSIEDIENEIKDK